MVPTLEYCLQKWFHQVVTTGKSTQTTTYRRNSLFIPEKKTDFFEQKWQFSLYSSPSASHHHRLYFWHLTKTFPPFNFYSSPTSQHLKFLNFNNCQPYPSTTTHILLPPPFFLLIFFSPKLYFTCLIRKLSIYVTMASPPTSFIKCRPSDFLQQLWQKENSQI